ncbi:hypothetical protein BK659_12070 [Pseudomonas brassicacearum]|uniref:Uncharacterized protein n=1 Tax=Pseudomonas brassicacearum TaxID=930166 RepID=A0A423H716_9PSED|nr:hypothetical protein BK659_12070 [Pseudomonas brassicacearum]
MSERLRAVVLEIIRIYQLKGLKSLMLPIQKLPAPSLPSAYRDCIFLEDILGGAEVYVALSRGMCMGARLTLQFCDGVTSWSDAKEIVGSGCLSFTIPSALWVKSLNREVRLQYLIDGQPDLCEILYVGVCSRL